MNLGVLLDQPFDETGSSWVVKLGRRIFPLRGLAGLPYLIGVVMLVPPARSSWEETGAGWLCLLLGLFLRIWGVAGWYAGGERAQTAGLITRTGPYAFTRNPRYLGNLALGVGACWLFGAPHCAWAFCLLWGCIHLPVICAEEAVLTRRYGSDYSDYCRCVPRFLGANRSACSLLSRLLASHWAPALRDEKQTWSAWLLLGFTLQAYQRHSWNLSWLPLLLSGSLLVSGFLWMASRRAAGASSG